MRGRSDSLRVTIPLEPAKEKIKTGLTESLMKSPPPQFQGVPPAMLQQYISEAIRQIPSTFELNENTLPQEARIVFQEIRHNVGYYQLVYWGMVCLIILLILLIFLISRNISGTARIVGVTFLCYGAIDFAAIWAGSKYATPFLQLPGVPSALQSWMLQVTNDFLALMQMFNIGLMVVGVILLILSFVYRKPAEA